MDRDCRESEFHNSKGIITHSTCHSRDLRGPFEPSEQQAAAAGWSAVLPFAAEPLPWTAAEEEHWEAVVHAVHAGLAELAFEGDLEVAAC